MGKAKRPQITIEPQGRMPYIVMRECAGETMLGPSHVISRAEMYLWLLAESKNPYRISRLNGESRYNAKAQLIGNKILAGLITAPGYRNLGARELFERSWPNPDDPAVVGVTDFMVGWAVNAARYAIGLEPLPNPGLVNDTMGVERTGRRIQ